MSSQFDGHASTYDEDLNQALSVTGEDKRFFAEQRVAFLARCLEQLGEKPRSAIDYGCGTGNTAQLLRDVLQLESVIGLDVSAKSLQIAENSRENTACSFLDPQNYAPEACMDLVYCNGVFHHISKSERPAVISYIHRCLRPRGTFALWENNPLNPGTRYVMSQCTFDRDAVPIRSGEARKLLCGAGFHILSMKYMFFFPGFLRTFRFMEPYLSEVPLGAQYQILCRKT